MAWNPSERDRSGELLMQGMSGFGRGVGYGLEQHGRNKRAQEIMEEERKEKAKDEADMGKASETAFRIMAKQGGAQLGVSEEEFRNLGAREKTAIVTGIMKAQGAQEVMQRLQTNQGRIDETQRVQDQEAAFNSDIEGMMGHGVEAPVPRQVMGAAARRGMLNPGNIRDFMAMQPEPQMPVPAGFEPSKFMRGGVTYEKPAAPLPKNFEPQRIMRDGVTYGPPEKPLETKSYTDPKTGRNYVVHGKQILPADRAEKEKQVALPNDPALYGDDDEAFGAFVRTLEDEDQRKRAVEFRKMFKGLTKEEELDPFKEAMLRAFAPEKLEEIRTKRKPAKTTEPASQGGRAAFTFDPKSGGIAPVK